MEAEQTRIMYDSITVLQGPPAEAKEPQQRLPTIVEEPEEEEPETIDPGILLQQMTTEDEPATGGSTQRSSARSTKGTITSKKFADEDFDKPPRVRMAKLARTWIQTTRTNQLR